MNEQYCEEFAGILELRETDFLTKYLVFREIGQKPKTKVYGVYTRQKYNADSSVHQHHLLLGTIYFFAHWRQYIFQAVEQPVLAPSCLVDIVDYLKKLNTKPAIQSSATVSERHES